MSDLKSRRPLSPHLSIYRFRPTMAMSILHRITGGALYFGTILVVWWLAAAASGPEAYESATSFFGNFLIQIVLIGYTWALIHHALGGIRHFIWDTGHGLSKETSTKFAQATIAGSLAITVLLWLGIWIFA
ncbi:succinate dehydrogenase, cytochrome b556 subunit [Fulvimarina endophytica]|uniref:Succinate dehydrogenase cytochrome b556 subunit n=1 Tax=Fulvimarina endophytica TaxID=2293836 RepID=A0A371XA89_9HYPH|nr:succinate dehydrogenase, cytochrome b556 subunit [Fulvimarina endophytica]RFC66145.1 succinate dehydrogenase, cytochrome b556 subunit [Fulvimarina endophytica]